MSPTTLERYIELRRQMFAIDAEIETLKEPAIQALRAQGEVAFFDDLELRLGRYTAWEYSQSIKEMQGALNEAKRRERQNGQAQVRERRDMLVLKVRRAEPANVKEAPEEVEWIED